jgi:hypothetical protein
MKLGNHDIQALAKKLFHHNRGVKRAKLMHPNRDWLIGVLVGILIIVLMIGWSAYTYLEKRDALELTDTSIEPVVPVYNADIVQDALELYTRRDEVFARLNQSSVSTIDPEVGAVIDPVSTTTSSTTNQVAEELPAEEIAIEEEGDQTIDPPQLTSPESTPENDISTETPTLID